MNVTLKKKDICKRRKKKQKPTSFAILQVISFPFGNSNQYI